MEAIGKKIHSSCDFDILEKLVLKSCKKLNIIYENGKNRVVIVMMIANLPTSSRLPSFPLSRFSPFLVKNAIFFRFSDRKILFFGENDEIR